MRRRYSISLYTWGDRPFPEVVAEAARAGFQCCELNQAVLDTSDAAVVEEAGAVLRSHGMQPSTMHATGGRLAATEQAERDAAIRRVVDGFAGYAALGGEVVVVHPSHRLVADVPVAQQTAAQLDAIRRSVPVLAEHAERVGLRVALENLPPKGDGLPRPLSRMADLRRVVDELPDSVGICLDTRHAVLNDASPADEARLAGQRLIATHLHDSDAESDHWVPGERGIDWPAVVAALQEVDYAGAWTFEVIRAGWRDGALSSARQTHAVLEQWERIGA